MMMGQIEKGHFEVMEELGQMNIFDLPEITSSPVPAATTIEEKPIEVGDKVRCTVDLSESETYYYLKYYFPNALTCIGEVENIDGNVIAVRFKGETVLLEKHQVSL